MTFEELTPMEEIEFIDWQILQLIKIKSQLQQQIGEINDF